MSRILFLMVTVIAIGTAYAGPVWGTADLTVESMYLWRGIVSVDAPVLQPWAAFGTGGFSITGWGSMELSDENYYGEEEGYASGEFTEFDLILDYTHDFGPAWVYAGFGKYWYPNTGYESTSEIYLSGGPNVVLSPALNIVADIEEVNGVYASLSAAHSIPVCCTSADLSLGIGYGNADHNAWYYGTDKGALADLTLGAAFPFALPAGLTVTPTAELSTLLDSEIKDLVQDDTNFRGGLSVTWNFL